MFLLPESLLMMEKSNSRLVSLQFSSGFPQRNLITNSYVSFHFQLLFYCLLVCSLKTLFFISKLPTVYVHELANSLDHVVESEVHMWSNCLLPESMKNIALAGHK